MAPTDAKGPPQALPWPLPDEITRTIGHLAGREASAALCIALGHREGALAAHEALFREPFTYWDWCELPENDSSAKDWKRQRLWENQRGFKANGTNIQGYPTARERWRMFKARVEGNAKSAAWVTRIAVAHWMGEEDVRW